VTFYFYFPVIIITRKLCYHKDDLRTMRAI